MLSFFFQAGLFNHPPTVPGETHYSSLICSNYSEIQSFQSMLSKLTAAVFDQEIKLKQNNSNEVKKEEGKA